MEFHIFRNLQVFLVIFMLMPTFFTAQQFPITNPNCIDHCGDVSIPYPFGITEGCSRSSSFRVTCDLSSTRPKLSWNASNPSGSRSEIMKISLDGQLRILQRVAHDCYRNETRISYGEPYLVLPLYFTINNTANKYTILGCDAYSYSTGYRDSYITGSLGSGASYRVGALAVCSAESDLVQGTCLGLGCSQTTIPTKVSSFEMGLNSFRKNKGVEEFNKCNYAFFVDDESDFKFQPDLLKTLPDISHEIHQPMVVDWVIENGTCQDAKMNVQRYACKSSNSECYEPSDTYGYRCSCQNGYEGNPYLNGGCKDIDECTDPVRNNCEMQCENTQGSYKCLCPKGYHGDGIKGSKGCIRNESTMYKLVSGVSVGAVVVLLCACWLYIGLRRRRSSELKKKYFLQNGGTLLKEKLEQQGRSSDMGLIFSSAELIKATNNFHNSMIIGQGGFGVVYKGYLADKRIVAIKKSKEVDPTQIDQFINEVIILSQINHRNVVKLFGCCLELQVPLLVYEFISNGNLYEYIHTLPKTRFFDWDMRLKMATETAGVLSYLHSAASTPIIHRDVKSANILLDHNFTVKVADFGASRLVPIDQTQLSTMVQGTFGYLDPEYMQTNQLTEKSDVYSFGVVLAELLTGRKALSYDKPEEERNLANFFLTALKQQRLSYVLDNDIVWEKNKNEIVKVASLAKGCLIVKGEDRPSMKEVAIELEGLRLGEKHSWDQHIDHNEESIEMQLLLGEGPNSLNSIYSNGKSIGSLSLKDHIILRISGSSKF